MFKRVLLLAATLVLGAVGVVVLQVTESSPSTAVAGRWQPGPHEPWQWMISGTFNVNNPDSHEGRRV